MFPVHLLHRQSLPKTAKQGLRILESCGTRLLEKGLYVNRTLIFARGTSLTPVRILNTSDKTQTLGAQSVVAVAKAVTSIAELKLPQVDSESTTREVHRNHPEEKHEETLPGPLKELWERSSEQLTEEESHAVAKLLHRHKDVFSLSEQDRLGRTKWIKHHFDMGDAIPVKQQPRRGSPSKHAEIGRQVEDILPAERHHQKVKQFVVVPSSVGDEEGFCVDYRQVNAVTIKDAYPLPHIDDSLCAILGAKWFSTLYRASGYWQVPMDPASGGKAAFVTTPNPLQALWPYLVTKYF